MLGLGTVAGVRRTCCTALGQVAVCSTSYSSTASVGPSAPAAQYSTQPSNWDWEWVLGQKKSRKNAIKRPARHQWWYCNPNYDPNAPLPARMLPPHAPPSALLIDDRKTYTKHLPSDPAAARKYRHKFVQFLKLRDVDWRDAFQQGLAEDVRLLKKRKKLEAEAHRQKAWQDYKEALFQQARTGAGLQSSH